MTVGSAGAGGTPDGTPAAAAGAVPDESLWAAVAGVAAVWADLEPVRLFAAQLPRNVRPGSAGLPHLLQEVSAMGGDTWVEGRPFQLGTYLPMLLAQPHLAGAMRSAPSNELPQWLALASRLSQAHLDQLAWVRARLPGYPMLPAPQLAPGSPWTTREFTNRVPWLREHLSAGLQLRPDPGVAPLLTGNWSEQRAIDDAARGLADAFVAHPVVRRFADALSTLEPEDVAQLRAARSDLRAALAPENVDAHEPRLALARGAFREEVTANQLARLTGRAQAFTAAFDAVDDLLELVTQTIQQLAVFGPPVGVALGPDLVVTADRLAGAGHRATGDADADVAAGPRGRWAAASVSATLVHDGRIDFPRVGMLLRPDDPLLPDVIGLRSLTVSLGQVEGDGFSLTARVLPGTAAGWAGTRFGA